MTLLALGINHKTAPVSLRERVSFSPDKLDQALDSLLAQPMVQGGVVLSTCNRTELYLSVEEQDNLQEALIRWLCDYHNLNEEDLRKSLYWHQDNDAVSHLMRVASGLDSLVLGEPQILGQVKKAFADSQKGHMKASELERMFQKSFSVAKRVRTETDIGASAVSVAFAACTLARQIFESLSTVTVLLVGAGETIELVARHLREHKVQKMIIANRTRERAQILADEVGAEVIALSDIDERLREEHRDPRPVRGAMARQIGRHVRDHHVNLAPRERLFQAVQHLGLAKVTLQKGHALDRLHGQDVERDDAAIESPCACWREAAAQVLAPGTGCGTQVHHRLA